MSAFTNIRPKGTNGQAAPFLLNGKSLSLISQHSEAPAKEGQPEKQTLAFYDAQLGRQLWIDQKEWGVEPAEIAASLRQDGVKLFELPLIWGDMRPCGTAWINPEAFLSIIVSEASLKDGAKEESAAVLINVAGYGRVESYDVPLRVIEDFMAQVRAVKPHLMHVTPKDATSRWTKPGYVTFDKAAVSMIRPNGYDLDVILGDVARIDFNLKDGKGGDLYNQKNEYANALIRRVYRRGLLTRETTTQDHLHDVFDRAEQHYRRRQSGLREKFAAAIAAGNPRLLKFEGAKAPNYVRREDIFAVSVHDDCVQAHFRHAARHYDNDLAVHYATPEKARIGARLLQDNLCGTGQGPRQPNCS